MSEQELSSQRRELLNDQDRSYELVESSHEEHLKDGLELAREGRVAAEVTEETVRVTIERALKITTHPSVLDVVPEIEEEEDVIEMVSAMIIADAAAITAAQAAALAEASSKRVREARANVLQADLKLDTTRAAIRKGKLLGGDAEISLKAAVREATQARTVLADAEAAEKSALSAAMNAEAEAKATENLAFITNDHNEKLRD